jgi:3-oxoacyl-[acyl-carrier protein] reductase
MQLQNRRCVVTGAASGIGEAIALLFAGEGLD